MAKKNALANSSRRDLAKLITLAESTRANDRKQVLKSLVDYDNVNSNTLRIGISGAPGVGKSTFVEAFGLYLVQKQKRHLAVLTADPSSPVRGGSLLGDKTRMQDLSRESNAFIRSAPTGGYLGGLSRATRESLFLCEMSGYDTIVLETVGVGQSEYDVAHLVDVFILLLQPGAGDALQGVKRGILELVDMVVINKSDGAQRSEAEATANHYRDAFQLSRPDLVEQVFLCSALESSGMEELYGGMRDYHERMQANNQFLARRREQNAHWLGVVFEQLLMDKIHADKGLLKLREELRSKVAAGELSTYQAASLMMKDIPKEFS